MAKKKNKSSKSKTPAQSGDKPDLKSSHPNVKARRDNSIEKDDEKGENRVTMEALEAMSDTSSELPPEEEWDEKAKALKHAIETGAFDHLLQKKNKKSATDDDDDDDESIPEIELGDDDSWSSGGEDSNNDEAESDQKKGHKKFDDADSEQESVASSEEDKQVAAENDEEKEEEEESSNQSENDEEKEEEQKEEDDDHDNERASKKQKTKVVVVTGVMDNDEASASSEEQGNDQEGETQLNETKEDANAYNDDEEDDMEEDEEDDGGEINVNSLQKKNQISSKALHIAMNELLAARKDWPWAETFDITPSKPLPFGSCTDDIGAVDIHDDLKREVTFYDMALEAVTEARSRCKDAGIPFSRPDDFFAEMVKTDDHMARVKDRLIFETKKMQAVAQRKSNKEQQLRAKEAMSNKVAEKAKRKREHAKAVEEWAQSAASNRGRRLNDNDAEMLQAMNKNKGPNKKRLAADKKYGYGGKRGRFKQNDKKDLNDMSGFNPRGNFSGGMKRTSNSSKKGSSGAGSQRKGKRARDASRSRRG